MSKTAVWALFCACAIALFLIYISPLGNVGVETARPSLRAKPLIKPASLPKTIDWNSVKTRYTDERRHLGNWQPALDMRMALLKKARDKVDLAIQLRSPSIRTGAHVPNYLEVFLGSAKSSIVLLEAEPPELSKFSEDLSVLLHFARLKLNEADPPIPDADLRLPKTPSEIKQPFAAQRSPEGYPIVPFLVVGKTHYTLEARFTLSYAGLEYSSPLLGFYEILGHGSRDLGYAISDDDGILAKQKVLPIRLTWTNNHSRMLETSLSELLHHALSIPMLQNTVKCFKAKLRHSYPKTLKGVPKDALDPLWVNSIEEAGALEEATVHGVAHWITELWLKQNPQEGVLVMPAHVGADKIYDLCKEVGISNVIIMYRTDATKLRRNIKLEK